MSQNSGFKLHSYDEEYFKNIDSKEKAYWLGFIMADGYIYDNRETKGNGSQVCHLRIRLAENEVEHLEKFKKAMNATNPIRIVKNYGIYKGCKNLSEIQFYSVDLIDDLRNLGFSSGNKSCKEFIPKCISKSKSLKKSFFLGYFDGDGSIYIGKTVEFSLFSSKYFCLRFKKYFERNLNISFNKMDTDHRCKTLHRIRTSNKKYIKKIRKFLYKNEPVYLERKFQKMYEI